jgi:hypothetical protein
MEKISEYKTSAIARWAGEFLKHLAENASEGDVQRFVSTHLMHEVDTVNEDLLPQDIHRLLQEARIEIRVLPAPRVSVWTDEDDW